MSLDHQIGQLFFIGLQGTELLPDEANFIMNNNIGGVTLFGRNIESPQQIHKLCSDIQNLRHKMPEKTPLFIAIDMEGGRVHRLKPPFTQWPAIKNLGDLDSTSLAFKFSMAMGEELKAVGINLDFAPCVDTLTNPKNELIGDRSVGTDVELVARITSALVRGYIKSGITPCVKHFPGHGNTIIDSHEDLPIEETTLEILKERELSPFKKVFRARVDLVMTGHLKFTHIDPDYPVTLSKKFIQEILRKDMRYQKLVITDDLDMKALANHYKTEDIPVMALQAGCDILLYCNEFHIPPIAIAAVKEAVANGTLDKSQIEGSYRGLMELKKKALQQPDPIDFNEAAKIIGHPDHIKLAKAIESQKIPDELMG